MEAAMEDAFVEWVKSFLEFLKEIYSSFVLF